MNGLDHLLESLHNAKSVRDKVAIRQAYAPALPFSSAATRLGDDCAVLPDGCGGHLLFAAEGLLDDFVSDDPWFAGYSAIMVNVNDVAAMGGRPVAVVDVLWTPAHERANAIWAGMRTAAEKYGVPIVGGHTTISDRDHTPHLAVSILGRASSLLTSFDAQPGDEILLAVDLNGNYRGQKPFWDSSVHASPKRLRTLTELLPQIAEHGWCQAAKDVSNGGIVGTLIMLLECSQVGAALELDELPSPDGVDRLRWLLSFPSYGYLLSVGPRFRAAVTELFAAHGVTCRSVGRILANPQLLLRSAGQERCFWSAPSGNHPAA